MSGSINSHVAPPGLSIQPDLLGSEHLVLAAQLFEMTVAPSDLVRGQVTLNVSLSSRNVEAAESSRPLRAKLGIRKRQTLTLSTGASRPLRESRENSRSALLKCTITIPLIGVGRLSIHAVHRDPAQAIKQVFARAQRELQRRRASGGKLRGFTLSESFQTKPTRAARATSPDRRV